MAILGNRKSVNCRPDRTLFKKSTNKTGKLSNRNLATANKAGCATRVMLSKPILEFVTDIAISWIKTPRLHSRVITNLEITPIDQAPLLTMENGLQAGQVWGKPVPRFDRQRPGQKKHRSSHHIAPVAQGIEHRIPNPCAAGSNPAGGTNKLCLAKNRLTAPYFSTTRLDRNVPRLEAISLK